ncbi:TonB-dependent receptor plug domain-containing protein [Ramlibacter albus]|uniref:TonB-dependent receptor n=1 Tax=Ramlibacter albus TaxID=2079448 RepID=A0A923S900_9BURK|nr:TonB-dependent receptor [Ramlibacter albus]MBC5768577.1 TonB-dependent receptor [Ramlibacter albus]
MFRTEISMLAACALAGAAHGQNLADLSLDQLSRIEVTSVGKRLQRVADVAGSVYVITADDIRRCGATTLPEVLRLAPNLQVARVDGAQYAISARTGTDLLANKMLVLVDGRTVYSPLFSGVFWEAIEMPLDDIERIEVLSGSGGTLYGSNAFHGVINIVTRSAGETAGTLVKGAVGTSERFVTLRHGAASDAGAFRVFAKKRDAENTQRASGAPVRDASRHQLAGFRWDGGTPQRQFTGTGEVYHHRTEDVLGERDYHGAYVLGRYIEDAGGRRTQLQAYADRLVRERSRTIRNTVDTLDLELQQQQLPTAGMDLLWGAGWRLYRDDAQPASPAALDLLPRRKYLHLWNAFAQVEMEGAAASRFTLGLKAEHNAYTGLELLPTLRYSWRPSEDSNVWAAASRVVRTPARVDRDVASPPLVPNPSVRAEKADIAELGWRGRFGSGASASLTAFAHRFGQLRSFDLNGATGVFANNYGGWLRGLEGWAEWFPAQNLRLKAGMLLQHPRYDAAAGTSPQPPSVTLGNDARHLFKLGVAWDVRHNVWVDFHVRHVGRRPAPAVPSYLAADARVAWRPAPSVELSAAVRNLGEPRHVEWGAPATASLVPRSLLLQFVWWP